MVGGPFPPQAESAEIYDPAIGSWGHFSMMLCCRFDHTSTLLLDGRVLVAGGTSAVSALFDPVSESWSDGATMTAVRTSHTSAR